MPKNGTQILMVWGKYSRYDIQYPVFFIFKLFLVSHIIVDVHSQENVCV